ncbi:nitroreductase family deazaflavin-dependent oxidoreductase [Rhodococcus sp. RS1C4]|uniref:nitroreductase family deazaflavin-dependent oxidoreductase n=1 Tax=Nocardiaceae TaxID=85025 RepID=UPI00036B5055|nr:MULTISPECIES: nitroreductase family deazaflavin-dependent oxidoreductase [Rhodococcus]OZC46444.1 nitroreductase family deazaflavin-dependent oxidoreductase [Rhodococcus sp. RS1C4]OZC89148.1 nitroreductase family deazaflavin-dependent oxidoreductase [Rhodococcus sp. 06-418-1B]OZD17410.1 nitroreductase family deazaflavin-dependent oxidoreductase [Rhodococcus sp. 06-156-4C]OZD25144.1 nitroreductase family deazaflavin-dependent oxidoreductase [Rhodococcus sp. 06-156-4a]OZD26857.1 nitroreductase
MPDFNDQVVAEFRANHGKVGGPFEGAPLLLLHTVGAKSGADRLSPLMYLPDGDRYVIFASKAGADTNPAWYHNLLANPAARIEVGDDTIDVVAREIEGDERDALYRKQAELYSGFADYEKKTTRVIPVVALSAS